MNARRAWNAFVASAVVIFVVLLVVYPGFADASIEWLHELADWFARA